jgi:hypothetical protein
VVAGAAIAVCLSAEENCAAFTVRAIDNAEREILVGAYGLTTGSSIIEVLVRANGRGDASWPRWPPPSGDGGVGGIAVDEVRERLELTQGARGSRVLHRSGVVQLLCCDGVIRLTLLGSQVGIRLHW